jgi:hypothetical protein
MLKSILSVVTDLIPVIGSIKSNIESKDSGIGNFSTPRMFKSIIRLIIAVAACYLLVKGQITADELKELTK